MKRVLVTGATGAIGIAFIKELISHNVEVLVFCREGSNRNQRIPTHGLVTRKYYSLETLNDIQNDTGKIYDIFFHFAWEGTVGSARDDMYMQNRNVRYALDAVNVASRFGCSKFVGTGSQAEYGYVKGVLRPDTPAFPETGYGIAKLCAGYMTRKRSHQLGMEHNWVRILSVFGLNDSEHTMVMSAIRQLKDKKIPSFTEGEQIWDYLYCKDAAKALRLIGERGIDGKTYVLGSGNAKPLKEYIMQIRDAVDPDLEVGLGKIPYRGDEVMNLCADISELTKDTGWVPETDFEDGIREILGGG